MNLRSHTHAPWCWLVMVATAASLIASFGCRPDRRPLMPPGYVEPELGPREQAHLDGLIAAAQADPDDFATQKAAGLEIMWFTLAGHLSLRDTAEHHLEAAFALRSDDPELNRSLGRFYNMRTVNLDTSKAEAQVEVYHALLGDRDPATMTQGEFVAWSFFQMGRALTHYERRRLLQALIIVRQLERTLATQVRNHPNNVEFRALAGNFAFFFAGNLPFGKRRRIRQAIEYFEYLRTHWDELRLGARDPYHCPNTYENFMFELAEGYLALERTEQARAIYLELSGRAPAPVDRSPDLQRPKRTRARAQVAAVSRQRLEHLETYAGDLELMPPWPSDVGNCVVCHSWTADVPLASLHARGSGPAMPSSRELSAKPLRRPGSLIGAPSRRAEPLPEGLRSLLRAECSPCHYPGGSMAVLLDFSDPAQVRRKARWLLHEIETGDMPPSGPLTEDEVDQVRRWLTASDGNGPKTARTPNASPNPGNAAP